MDEKRLTEIRERAEAATEGPWRSHDFGHAGEEEPSSIVVHTGEFDHSDLRTYDTETAVAWMPQWDRQESDDATFIAHARTDVPDLLAEVERLRAGIEREADPQNWSTPVDSRRHSLLNLLNPPTEGETDQDRYDVRMEKLHDRAQQFEERG